MLLLIAGAKPCYHWLKSVALGPGGGGGRPAGRAGKWQEAAEKYRAALQLDPLGYPALKGAARLASKLGRPEALDLWEQVVKRPAGTVADRQEYADQLLAAGRRKVAESVIENLLKTAPDAKTLELASRYARAAGERSKALTFARLAVKKSPNDDLARFRVAELLAESADPQERAEARYLLWGIASKEGPVRLSAVEALGRAPDLSKEEQAPSAENSAQPQTGGDQGRPPGGRFAAPTGTGKCGTVFSIRRWFAGTRASRATWWISPVG